jgi:hypothetical protein
VYTHRFGTGPGTPVAELGAMRIPAGHRRVLDYVDRLGLAGELRPFRGLRPEPVHLPPPGPHAAETRLVGARLTAMVDAVAPPPVRQDVRRDLHAGLLDRLDRLDLRPYATAPDGVHELLAAHPELRSACSGELRDFLDDILTETGTSLLRIRGGMGRLVDELAARVRGAIRLGRPVVRVADDRTEPAPGPLPQHRRRQRADVHERAQRDRSHRSTSWWSISSNSCGSARNRSVIRSRSTAASVPAGSTPSPHHSGRSAGPFSGSAPPPRPAPAAPRRGSRAGRTPAAARSRAPAGPGPARTR